PSTHSTHPACTQHPQHPHHAPSTHPAPTACTQHPLHAPSTQPPCSPSLCHVGIPNPCNTGIPGLCCIGIPSPCQMGIPSPCHMDIPSPCHVGIPSLCHLGTPSPCHLGIPILHCAQQHLGKRLPRPHKVCPEIPGLQSLPQAEQPCRSASSLSAPPNSCTNPHPLQFQLQFSTWQSTKSFAELRWICPASFIQQRILCSEEVRTHDGLLFNLSFDLLSI
uniref:Uncharacterized protein n=1 Tax=Pavo cristatus TaxID=9049 RepID=A0A8C9FGM2_PAVCR